MMFEDSLSLQFLSVETSLWIISKQQAAGEGRQDVPLMMDVMMDAASPPCLPGGFAQGE